MRDLFTIEDFTYWNRHCFTETYPGYRKAGFEQPDSGYGSGYDYTHIALKYLRQWDYPLPGARREAYKLLDTLLLKAQTIAVAMGTAPDLIPTAEDSTLRILRYPPGAVSNEHTDFCLFTIPLWRNSWEHYHPRFIGEGRMKDGLHYGELLAATTNKIATPHSVSASPVWQYSAVYFAMPALDTKLPSGETVAQYVAKRKEETRK